MMLARNILGGLSAAAVLAASALWVFNPTVTMHVPEDRLQGELQARLPLTRKVGPAMVTVTQAKLTFEADGRLRMNATAALSGAGVDEDVSVNAITGIRYDRGRVYLTESDLSDVALSPEAGDTDLAASGSRMAQLRVQMMARALPAITEQLEARLRVEPVVDLNDAGFKSQFVRLVVDDIQFDKKGVRVDFALSNLPLHLLLVSIALVLAGAAKWVGRRRD
jgi:hypothetical protein